jgi:hypothetical protein
MMVFPLGDRVDLIFHNNKRPVRKCQGQMLLMRIVRVNQCHSVDLRDRTERKKAGTSSPGFASLKRITA